MKSQSESVRAHVESKQRNPPSRPPLMPSQTSVVKLRGGEKLLEIIEFGDPTRKESSRTRAKPGKSEGKGKKEERPAKRSDIPPNEDGSRRSLGLHL